MSIYVTAYTEAFEMCDQTWAEMGVFMMTPHVKKRISYPNIVERVTAFYKQEGYTFGHATLEAWHFAGYIRQVEDSPDDEWQYVLGNTRVTELT